MPTYEYVCSKCGQEFELFQSIKATPLMTCPENVCAQKKWGRGRVKRKLSAGAGLIFKGSGFYITDYRSDGYKQAAKKESDAAKPASSDGKASQTTAASTKPAAKSESKSKPSATNT